MPTVVRAWFAWAFLLLVVTGLLLGRIVEFVDFSERAPFSILGVFMMAELAAVIFGITVALQRKRIARPLTVAIAALGAPVLGGLPPALLQMPDQAATGWYGLFVPVGLIISVVLIIGLTRPAARAWFSES